MSKFLYPIYKLKIENYKKWWLYHKKAGILSEILQGFSFNLENTLDRKFKLFDVEGHSKQETRSYKGLFRVPEALSQTINGLTFKVNNDGSVTVTGTTTDTTTIDLELESPVVLNGTYTFSVKRTGTGGASDQQWILYKGTLENKQSLGLNPGLNGNVTNTVEATATILRVFTANAKTINCTIYPILEEGSTVTDWDVAETHTTPNPDYEEPIKSSGDNGSITEKITNADGTEEQTHTIPVQQPMRSIGDVRDCFVKKSDGWYERHMPYIASYNGETLPQDVYNEVDNVKYCNEKSMSTTGQFSIGASVQYIDENNWNDLPCTEEQIEILENPPKTYAGQTNIDSEDKVKPYLRVQYYKER